jgi:hypothetical protein
MTDPDAPTRSMAAGGEPAARPAPPRRPAKPRAGWVFGGAFGAFCAALALLAFQVRAGQDPALGPAQPVAQVQPAKPRRILIRKVIKRVVIHHSPTASAPAAPAQTSSAPQTTTSAPAPSPAPAPAPAPAPLTTQSS